MSTVALNKEDFGQTVQREGIVLVDFWADWCGPCHRFSPVFEQASLEHPDIVFGKVDTEAEPELASAAQITSIPTLMVFRDGVLVFRQPGALPSSALTKVIDAVRELDMDELRSKLSDHSAV